MQQGIHDFGAMGLYAHPMLSRQIAYNQSSIPMHRVRNYLNEYYNSGLVENNQNLVLNSARTSLNPNAPEFRTRSLGVNFNRDNVASSNLNYPPEQTVIVNSDVTINREVGQNTNSFQIRHTQHFSASNVDWHNGNHYFPHSVCVDNCSARSWNVSGHSNFNENLQSNDQFGAPLKPLFNHYGEQGAPTGQPLRNINFINKIKSKVMNSERDCDEVLNKLPEFVESGAISQTQKEKIEVLATTRKNHMNWPSSTNTRATDLTRAVEHSIEGRTNIFENCELGAPSMNASINVETLSVSNPRLAVIDKPIRFLKTKRDHFEAVLVHFKGVNSEKTYYPANIQLVCTDGIVTANKDILIAGSAFFCVNLIGVVDFLALNNWKYHDLAQIVKLLSNGVVAVLKKNVPKIKASVNYFKIRGVYFSNELDENVCSIEKVVTNDSIGNLMFVELPLRVGSIRMVKCCSCGNVISRITFPSHYKEYHIEFKNPTLCCNQPFYTKFSLAYHRRMGICNSLDKLPSSYDMPNSSVQVNLDVDRPRGNAHSTPLDSCHTTH